MTDNQKEILSISYDIEAMSNVLKTNLKRGYDKAHIVQAQDVERVVSLHENAVRLQELAEGINE